MAHLAGQSIQFTADGNASWRIFYASVKRLHFRFIRLVNPLRAYLIFAMRHAHAEEMPRWFTTAFRGGTCSGSLSGCPKFPNRSPAQHRLSRCPGYLVLGFSNCNSTLARFQRLFRWHTVLSMLDARLYSLPVAVTAKQVP